ncbi:MAG: YHS domain-containing protein [Syntrophales bacterium LBB04]|nr:YHS domain-containing protein [Syntrophales bacterium LBB04]
MIVRLIITLLIIYLLYKLIRGIMLLSARGTENHGDREIANREDLVEDPFCHSYVPQSDAYRTTIEGRTVYFCSRDCYKKFRQENRKRQD